MPTYTKATLLQMNNDPTYGMKWIINIENIRDDELAILYPTGGASVITGKIYVALPATTIITEEINKKYKIWF
jgi:hypothetical protein